MANKHSGIFLISVPKSGTMFVSRYLEKLTGIPVLFGTAGLSETQLRAELACGWHPQIQEALREGSPSLKLISKRFAQMLARNRRSNLVGNKTATRILSDHGLENFLRFLVNPSSSEIQKPQQLLDWAEQQGLACVYLYRDIRAIANSLTHFLAAGKSFLVDIECVSKAAQLVSTFYVPVLAEQMRQWEILKNEPRLLSISYESIMKDPAHCMRLICQHGNLPFESMALLNTAESYPSWTFRKNKAAWTETFTEKQQRTIASFSTGGT